MATCSCGEVLPGRRQKCDACKDTGRTGAATTKKTRPGTKPRVARKAAAKKATTPAAPPEPTEPVVVYPDGLGSRGRQLWKALGHDIDTPGGILSLEACRCADRLERLDSLLTRNDEWFTLVEQVVDSGQMTVTINAPLGEARQQQVTLKQMLAELGATRVKGTGAFGGETGAPAPPAAPIPPATPLAAARERRRQREQKA